MAFPGCMEQVRKCCSGEVPDRLPVFACSEEMDVRLSPYTYAEYCSDAAKMADAQISAVKRFDYDWAWLQVDDCILFELLGVGVRGEGDILRATCDYLPASLDTLKSLPKIDVRNDGRCKVLLDAIKAVKDEFGDDVCVVGRTECPFTAIALLFGIDETMMLTITNPDLLKEANKYFIDIETAFGLAQIEAGADALWFGGCNESTHLMSVDTYMRLAFEPAKVVAEAYHRAGGLTFLHNSEERAIGLEAEAKLGVSAISVGPGGNMKEAREAVGPKQCLLGNINPILTLANGSVEDVERETRALVTEISTQGAHILNSGEMVPRDTPAANMEAMIRTARETWQALQGQ